MKFFHKLIILGITLISVLLSQSIEISEGLIIRGSSQDINIFVYNVTNLEAIQIEFEYDENIIIFFDSFCSTV